jgi:hypothetical protein
MKYLTGLLAMMFLFGCKGTQEVVEEEAPQEEVVMEGKPERKRTMMFTMERTPCFGKCPVDKAEFYNDGTIMYEGTRDGILDGKAIAYTDLSNEIMAIYGQYYSDDYKKKYNDPNVSDLPSTIITFYDAYGTPKPTEMRVGAPPELREMERKLDQLLRSIDNWEMIGGMHSPKR